MCFLNHVDCRLGDGHCSTNTSLGSFSYNHSISFKTCDGLLSFAPKCSNILIWLLGTRSLYFQHHPRHFPTSSLAHSCRPSHDSSGFFDFAHVSFFETHSHIPSVTSPCPPRQLCLLCNLNSLCNFVYRALRSHVILYVFTSSYPIVSYLRKGTVFYSSRYPS